MSTELQNVELPRDVPKASEEHFLAIRYEFDGIHWSFHDGVRSNYAPAVFWTTSHLEREDFTIEPCVSLTRYLCSQAMKHFFGTTNPKTATKEAARKVATKRSCPFTTVYLLSNTIQEEKDIAFLFSQVPCRLFRFSKSDFFTQEQLGLSTNNSWMTSIGQLAALYASRQEYPTPLLLLNCGSAITYVGLDQDSRLIGGGACAGMPIRCRALFDYCSREFPSMDFEKYKAITNKAKEQEKPISLFSTNVEEGIVSNASSELAGHLRNIVKQFLQAFPTQKPTFIITGDDSKVVSDLLTSDCSKMVEPEPGVSFPSNLAVVVRKHMAAYGIQELLYQTKEQKAPEDPDEELRENLIGIRIARVRENEEKDRGSILNVVRGKDMTEDTFVIALDNGETLSLDLLKLYDAMALYQEIGEEDPKENEEQWVGEKRDALEEVQVSLEERVDVIKKRKLELDASKEKDGTLVSIVSTPTREEPPSKKVRRSPQKTDDPNKYMGQRVGKYFDNPQPDDPHHQEIFSGTVDAYDEEAKLWHIAYDDGDSEEMDFHELREGILLYDKDDKP